MEDFFTNLLGNYAFPILVCIALGWYVYDLTNKNREDTKQLNAEHTKEMLAFKDDIKTAIDNNTKAIEMLTEKIKEGRI